MLRREQHRRELARLAARRPSVDGVLSLDDPVPGPAQHRSCRRKRIVTAASRAPASRSEPGGAAGPRRRIDGGPEAFAPADALGPGDAAGAAGAAPRIVREREAAGGCALAYAPEPVPGVPTIPLRRRGDGPARSAAARCRRRVRAFATAGRRRAGGAGRAPSAPSPRPRGGFAAPFDLVASAFVLLACWDERTSVERDRFGRLPYSASVFAANPDLRIEEPAVDGYVALLRALLAPRLDELGLEPLPPAGWMWGDGAAGDGPGRLRRRPHARRRQPVALDAARLRRDGLPQRPRPAPPSLGRAARRARRPARVADVAPAAPQRPVLDLPPAARAARTSAGSRRPSS